MMDDEFIDGVLTLDSQDTNATMNKKFIGMEAVQADNDSSAIGLDADSPSAPESGGDKE